MKTVIKMPFDGFMLKSIVDEIKFLEKGRIQKITQIGNNDFLFVIRKNTNYKVLISTDRNNARISLTEMNYDTPKDATMFTMLLRKHLEGGIINQINQYELDRILDISLTKLNEFNDNKEKHIIIELMGKNSNLIITDSDYEIIEALRHIGVNENAKIILPKAKYTFDESKKINLFTASEEKIKACLEKVESPKDFKDLFYGFSPLLANYIFAKDDRLEALLALKETSKKPILFLNKDKKDFYWFEIAPYLKEYSSNASLLDDYFYLKTISTLVDEKTNNLKTHLKHLLLKLENKIKKLNSELDEASNAEILKKYGEIIMANLYNHQKENKKEITLYDYYENKDITIPLDVRFDLKKNATNYFTKYQKSKKATVYIKEQINKAQDEIAYLNIILSQVQNASLKDIDEIKDELIKEKYLKEKSKETPKRKNKMEILTLHLDDTTIYVGKNNLQNEYVTHVLAKANDLWMHVKDAPGSHVIISKTGEFKETDIRRGAMLAAYFSTQKDSSSVPVNYTLARYVKKIPGKRSCFVTFSNEKTIYIDPDYDIVKDLIKN